MKGGKNRQPLGYTIVEVMIVLGVSGVMFLIASSFINGKQQRTAFTTGVNDMASQIQDSIEQVTDGKFSDVPVPCTFDGTPTGLSLVGSANAQGTGNQCVFLGKLMSFTNNTASPNYVLSSIAGGRLVASGAPTLANVDPTVMPGLDQAQTVPQGLDVSCVSVTVNGVKQACNAYENFGFVQGLGAGNADGTFQSGGQTVSLVYAPQAGTAENASNDNINGKLAYAQAASLCLTDGTRTAKLVLGGSADSQLNVDIQDPGGGATCP